MANTFEAQRIEAQDAFAARKNIEILSLVYYITNVMDNEQKQYQVAEWMSQYDGGALLKALQEIIAQKAMQNLEYTSNT